MRSWATWGIGIAALAIALVAFRDELGFLREAYEQLKGAHPLGVAAAVLFSLVAIVAMAEVMRLLLDDGHTRVTLARATGITLASNAWSTTLPGGPAFSALLTFHVQRRWGASIALCGWFLVVSAALSTLWLIVISVVAVIAFGADVNIASLLSGLVVSAAASGLVYWAMRNPQALQRWTRDRWPRVAKQIGELSEIEISPGRFARVTTWSLLNRLFDALTLAAAIWAATGMVPSVSAAVTSGEHATWATVLLGYVAAKVAGSAQVTPGGVGTVDAALIAAMVTTGLTAVDATAAAILYRLVSFLFVTLVGWIVYLLLYVPSGKGATRRQATMKS